MEELYKAIEYKIKESGYTREVSGKDIYDDICEQIEDKDNGNYLIISKFFEDTVFEYVITVMDEDFNLSVLTINENGQKYIIDFDK